MFSKLAIGHRLITLIAVTSLTLVIIGSTAFFAISYASDSSKSLHNKVNQTNNLSQLISGLQKNFVDTLNNLNAGTITWIDAENRVKSSRAQFNQDWNTIKQGASNLGLINKDLAQVNIAYDEFLKLGSNHSRASLELFILNDLNAMVDPFLSSVTAYSNQLTTEAELSFKNSEQTLNTTLYAGLFLLLAGLTASVVIGFLIRQSIISPVSIIAETVRQVKQENTSARTKLSGSDELSQLGFALDQLLDEKVATLVQAEKENEALNESIIELLEGTSQLSERDLTVKLTVNEDITGPVADALNLVTKETAEALAKIRQISSLVEESSGLVNQQTAKVTQVATQERSLLEQTIKKLERVSQNMNQIARWCQSSHQIAQRASSSTDKAYTAVTNTVSSMGDMRDSISETEKRLKRLSERSQEISGIVDMINNIAERTHVLALNASMQAAAAGEAGRGFAVVADEVQRLAESSRNSTSQIGSLVRNIQIETSEAVENMNNSISLVVDGSKRAEEAGQRMKETQDTTAELVSAVEKISDRSILQAKEVESLRLQSDKIKQSTQVTGNELKRQSVHTARLQQAALELTNTVTVFTIPEEMISTNTLSELLTLPQVEVEESEPELGGNDYLKAAG